MVKVYVAGAWTHRAFLSQLMDALALHEGIEVVSKWPSRENGDWTIEALENDAKLDVEEVLDADILLMIINDPDYAYRGTSVELGVALGAKKKILMLTCAKHGDYCTTNVFYYHPQIQRVSFSFLGENEVGECARVAIRHMKEHTVNNKE